jgi:hypothetical protein
LQRRVGELVKPLGTAQNIGVVLIGEGARHLPPPKPDPRGKS